MLSYPFDMVLGKEANIRVIRELSRHGGQLTAANLATRTGLTKTSVIAALRDLESLRLAEAAGSGQVVVHRLSQTHPLSEAITHLFEAEEERVSRIYASMTECVRTVAKADVIAIWVYGSVARGEDKPESDVDVAVVLNARQDAEIVDRICIGLHDLGERLVFYPSVAVLDLEDILRLATENDPWWQAVLVEAKTVLGASPAAVLEQLMRRKRISA